jgi:hypothetical protein
MTLGKVRSRFLYFCIVALEVDWLDYQRSFNATTGKQCNLDHQLRRIYGSSAPLRRPDLRDLQEGDSDGIRPTSLIGITPFKFLPDHDSLLASESLTCSVHCNSDRWGFQAGDI